MWIITSPPIRSRNGTSHQLNMQKILHQAPEADKFLKLSSSPLSEKLAKFLFFGSYIYSLLAQFKHCHPCFLVKTVSVENSATLCCTKIHSQAFLSKTQRLGGNFYILGGSCCCCCLAAVQQYIEAEFMSHNLVFKIE